MMAEGSYRLKIYGYSGDDPDGFCRDMAAVLAIDVETARECLASAPSVVKTGLSRATAEKVRDILAEKKGLILSEPENPDLEPESAIQLDLPISGPPDEQEDSVPVMDTRTALILGTVAAIILVMVVYLGVGLIKSVIKVKRESQPVEGLQAPAQEQRQSGPSPQEYRAMADELQARVQQTETDLEHLKFRLAEEGAAMEKAGRPRGGNPEEYRRLIKVVMGIIEEVRAMERELKDLRQELLNYEHNAAPAAPK